MTNHTLTEARAAELWDAHIPKRKTHYLGWRTFPEPSRRCFTTIIHAAFDAGREHERKHADPHRDPRPWQDCTRDDIRKSDLVETRVGDSLYFGVAHRQDEDGDWWTKDDRIITHSDRWPLRRIPAPNTPAEVVALPSRHPAHLLDVEQEDGDTCRYMALDRDGNWVGVDQDGELRTTTPDGIAECTLPDDTRLRRAGDHDNGTPRFVKEDA